MEALTEEQIKLIEDNHKLIYSYLHKNNLNINDYYDVVAVGLCKAAKGYNPIASEFSTFAYKCMFNEVSNYFKYNINGKTKVPENKLVSYDLLMDNEEVTSFVENDIIFNIDYLSFIKTLNDKERFILRKIQLGSKQNEIAKEIGQSQQSISLTVKKIKEKWDRYYNN